MRQISISALIVFWLNSTAIGAAPTLDGSAQSFFSVTHGTGNCVPSGCSSGGGTVTTTGGSGVCLAFTEFQSSSAITPGVTLSDSAGHTWNHLGNPPYTWSGNSQNALYDVSYMWYTSNLSGDYAVAQTTDTTWSAAGIIFQCFTGGAAGTTPLDSNGIVTFSGAANNGTDSWKVTQTWAANALLWATIAVNSYSGSSGWNSASAFGSTAATHGPNVVSGSGVLGLYFDTQNASVSAAQSAQTTNMTLSAFNTIPSLLASMAIVNTTYSAGSPPAKRSPNLLLMGVQ